MAEKHDFSASYIAQKHAFGVEIIVGMTNIRLRSLLLRVKVEVEKL